jgi:hypothetical protein
MAAMPARSGGRVSPGSALNIAGGGRFPRRFTDVPSPIFNNATLPVLSASVEKLHGGNGGLVPGSRVAPSPASMVVRERTSSAAGGQLTEDAVFAFRERLVERAGTTFRSCFVASVATFDTRALIEQWNSPIAGLAAPSELLLQAAAGEPAVLVSPESTTPDGNFVRSELSSPQPADAAFDPSSPEGARSICAHNGAFVEQAAATEIRELGGEVLSQVHNMPWVPSLTGSEVPGIQSQPAQAAPASLTRTQMLPLYEQDFDAGEDLSVLSGKIKSILDEEARRHGIDV